MKLSAGALLLPAKSKKKKRRQRTMIPLDDDESESAVGGRGGVEPKGYDDATVTLRGIGDASDALSIITQHHKRKTRDELKPFAVVEVEATTVSMTDCLIRRDRFLRTAKLPYKMGCDMVGRVVQAGRGARSFGISGGDRVCAMDFNLGGNSRFVSVPCYDLIKVPRGLDPAEVACLLRPYVTAYQCLHRVGKRNLRRGDRVLVTGGTGAVGQAVIELALAAGAKAVYATGKGEKDKRLINAKGATQVGREPEEWLPLVEGKMDVVIDSVCSDGYRSSVRALKDGESKLVCIGATAKQNGADYSLVGYAADISIMKASYFMSQTTFYNLFSAMEASPMEYREDLKSLFHLLKHGKIKPRIAMRVSLEEVIDAHEAIEHGGIHGNIVCQPNNSSRHRYVLPRLSGNKSVESRENADQTKRDDFDGARDDARDGTRDGAQDGDQDEDQDELDISDDSDADESQFLPCSFSVGSAGLSSSKSSETSFSGSFGTFGDESTFLSQSTGSSYESSLVSGYSDQYFEPEGREHKEHKKPTALSTVEEIDMATIGASTAPPSPSEAEEPSSAPFGIFSGWLGPEAPIEADEADQGTEALQTSAATPSPTRSGIFSGRPLSLLPSSSIPKKEDENEKEKEGEEQEGGEDEEEEELNSLIYSNEEEKEKEANGEIPLPEGHPSRRWSFSRLSKSPSKKEEESDQGIEVSQSAAATEVPSSDVLGSILPKLSFSPPSSPMALPKKESENEEEEAEERPNADYEVVRVKEESKPKAKGFWWKRSSISNKKKERHVEQDEEQDIEHVEDQEQGEEGEVAKGGSSSSESASSPKARKRSFSWRQSSIVSEENNDEIIDNELAPSKSNEKADAAAPNDTPEQGRESPFTSYFSSLFGDEEAGDEETPASEPASSPKARTSSFSWRQSSNVSGKNKETTDNKLAPSKSNEQAEATESNGTPEQGQESSFITYFSSLFGIEEAGDAQKNPAQRSSKEKGGLDSTEAATPAKDGEGSSEGGDRDKGSSTNFFQIFACANTDPLQASPVNVAPKNDDVPDSRETSTGISSLVKVIQCKTTPKCANLICQADMKGKSHHDTRRRGFAPYHVPASRRPSKVDPDLLCRIEKAASGDSSNGSTYFASGVAASKEDDGAKQKDFGLEISASSFFNFSDMLPSPTDSQKPRITKGLKKQRNHKKQRSLSSPSAGLVPFSRVQSSPSSITAIGSPVAVKCENSERQFHVSQTVASSVMSVSSSSGGGTRRHTGNFYVSRKAPSRSKSSPRLPPPSQKQRGKKLKNIFKKS